MPKTTTMREDQMVYVLLCALAIIALILVINDRVEGFYKLVPGSTGDVIINYKVTDAVNTLPATITLHR